MVYMTLRRAVCDLIVIYVRDVVYQETDSAILRARLTDYRILNAVDLLDVVQKMEKEEAKAEGVEDELESRYRERDENIMDEAMQNQVRQCLANGAQAARDGLANILSLEEGETAAQWLGAVASFDAWKKQQKPKEDPRLASADTVGHKLFVAERALREELARRDGIRVERKVCLS